MTIDNRAAARLRLWSDRNRSSIRLSPTTLLHCWHNSSGMDQSSITARLSMLRWAECSRSSPIPRSGARCAGAVDGGRVLAPQIDPLSTAICSSSEKELERLTDERLREGPELTWSGPARGNGARRISSGAAPVRPVMFEEFLPLPFGVEACFRANRFGRR